MDLVSINIKCCSIGNVKHPEKQPPVHALAQHVSLREAAQSWQDLQGTSEAISVSLVKQMPGQLFQLAE